MGWLDGDGSSPVWVGEVTIEEDGAEDYESDDGGKKLIHGMCSCWGLRAGATEAYTVPLIPAAEADGR